MKKLNKLDVDNEDIFEIIAKSKYRIHSELLLSNKSKITDRYREYINHIGTDSLYDISASEIDSDLEMSLLSCYESQTKVTSNYLLDIKNNVYSQILDYCPYCNYFSSNSIEHYLPQDDFPEFVIFSDNLVPACTNCNSKKKDYWKDQESRGIIHFYFDNLPNERYLFCDYDYNQSSIIKFTFKLDFPQNIVNKVKIIIEKHFLRLELLELYRKKSNSFFTELKEDIEIYRNKLDIDDITDILKEKLNNFEYRFGVNYWKYSLLDKIINSNEIIEKIYVSN